MQSAHFRLKIKINCQKHAENDSKGKLELICAKNSKNIDYSKKKQIFKNQQIGNYAKTIAFKNAHFAIESKIKNGHQAKAI